MYEVKQMGGLYLIVNRNSGVPVGSREHVTDAIRFCRAMNRAARELTRER